MYAREGEPDVVIHLGKGSRLCCIHVGNDVVN